MFISHDEEDSILEDKPLTSESGEASARALGTEDDASGQGARRFFAPSPRCLSPDNGSGTHSDREESTFSDDTEGSTSTLPCLGIGSDHYKELKRSLDSEKWLATNNDDGKIYYYEENGSRSQWKLPELDSFDEFDIRDGQQTSTLESQRVSLVTENLAELSKNIVKEGFLQRTFILKEGKKVRKNWTSSYARYIVSSFNSGSQGLIHFSKTKDDDKKAEIFDFIPPCSLDLSNDKKTSRQQVIALRNGHDTEVLLQFEDRDIENEWHKVLVDHDGMQQNMASVAEKEEKKGKKGSEKMKRAASIEQLAPDSKGITDKLLNFIKRRPLKETLEKKGIYKEAVFGSTLSELHLQDKTAIPIFVLQCINHIEKSVENLRTDGLYRISGNAAQIQKIRYEVAQRNYTILSREKEVHNLSGALKLFFRELKEPLIPFANYQDFIQATGSEYRKKNQQVEKLTKAVRQLPVENYDTMRVLLQHLLRVSEYESENRMSISNLAIVFGPCLLWPKITNAQDLMTDVMLHNRVIEGLLLDYQKIFSSKR
nr:rho GTPase-activating protein 27-like isoform X1 [Penaeus vannamei]